MGHRNCGEYTDTVFPAVSVSRFVCGKWNLDDESINTYKKERKIINDAQKMKGKIVLNDEYIKIDLQREIYMV